MADMTIYFWRFKKKIFFLLMIYAWNEEVECLLSIYGIKVSTYHDHTCASNISLLLKYEVVATFLMLILSKSF